MLRTLGRAGLVEALRGAGGGYRFSGNLRPVTLLDVIELFEDVSPSEGEGKGEPVAEARALLRVFHEVDDVARATLSSITLATMLKLIEEARRTPAAERRKAAAP